MFFLLNIFLGGFFGWCIGKSIRLETYYVAGFFVILATLYYVFGIPFLFSSGKG